MVQPVDALAQAFAQAGADLISFHPDASAHVHRSIQAIKAAGCQPGLVFNPALPLDVLDWVIEDIDLICYEREPRFWRAASLIAPCARWKPLASALALAGKDIRLEVDGGIKASNIRAVADAGADTFVAGSAIFGKPDYQAEINA